MAVTVDISAWTTLWDGSTTAGWTGGTPTQCGVAYGAPREGTTYLGWQVSDTTLNIYQAKSSFSLSGKAIYMWLRPNGTMASYSDGGVGIIIGDGTNRRAYHVGGGDQVGSFNVIGWVCYMFDPANPPAVYTTLAGSSQPNFGAVTQVGIRFYTVQKSVGGAINCYADIARVGPGLIVKGGTSGDPGSFAEIAADDESIDAGKAYGVIRTFQPGVYEVQGPITFGDNGTSDSYFEDQNVTLIFADNGAGDTFYKVSLIGNSTGTNSFVLGAKVGTGDGASGRAGCTIQSAGPLLLIDLDDANFDTVQVYGSKFYQCDAMTLPADTSAEFIGNSVIQSTGQIDGGQCIIRGCSFNGYTNDTDGHLLWNSSINIENCQFIANTDSVNDPHAIEIDTADTYSFVGLQFSGNDYDINNSSTGTVIINATSSDEGVESNPTSYENTNGGSTTINNTKTLRVSCLNTTGNGIQYVRIRIENNSTGALISEGVTNVDGIYIDTTYNYSGDVTVNIIARLKGFNFNKATDSITSSGLSVPFTMIRDPAINLP